MAAWPTSVQAADYNPCHQAQLFPYLIVGVVSMYCYGLVVIPPFKSGRQDRQLHSTLVFQGGNWVAGLGKGGQQWGPLGRAMLPDMAFLQKQLAGGSPGSWPPPSPSRGKTALHIAIQVRRPDTAVDHPAAPSSACGRSNIAAEGSSRAASICARLAQRDLTLAEKWLKGSGLAGVPADCVTGAAVNRCNWWQVLGQG